MPVLLSPWQRAGCVLQLTLALLGGSACQPASRESNPFAGVDFAAEDQRCSDGDRGACALLTHYYSTPWALTRSYHLVCLLGLSGWLLSISEPQQAPYARILSYARRGCELEHGFGCAVTARLYALGLGSDRDYRQGLHYAQQACALHFGGGCALWGDLLLLGKGTSPSLSAAEDAYEQGCILGDQGACSRLFELLGRRAGPGFSLADLQRSFSAMRHEEAARLARGARRVCTSHVGLRSNTQVPACLEESFRMLDAPP